MKLAIVTSLCNTQYEWLLAKQAKIAWETFMCLASLALLLQKCLTVCALDGAHDWTVLHEAVLERAALAVEAVQDPAHDAEGGEFAKEHAIASCKAYLQARLPPSQYTQCDDDPT